MKIALTGGSGRVGGFVIDELKSRNHDIVVLDQRRPVSGEAAFFRGDVLSSDDCRLAFEGAQAVIHLAAIPHLFTDPPEKVFHINTVGTYNVFQAAADRGVARVVYGSSDSSYGFNWRNTLDDRAIPAYLPVDEDHPQEPRDAYGLSKKVGEEIAKTFNLKYGMSAIALRISHVRVAEEGGDAGIDAYRRDMEDRNEMLPPRVYNKEGNVTRIYSYNDARDVGRAFRLAVEVEGLEGRYEAFNICADDNTSRFSSMEAIERFGWSGVPLRKAIEGRQSLLDWSKARGLLGFEPLYSWYELYFARVPGVGGLAGVDS